ncbi:MAG TPA: UDP-N-acetylmuramoyl-L-alanine--D-glutamate ligase [Rhodocyclaceae bacterium]
MRLAGKNILVLGLGESGLAMARWCARQGSALRVADSRAAPPNAAALARELPAAQLDCGPFTEALLDGIDRIALSPGVALAEPIVQAALRRGIPVVSEIELFAEGLRGQSEAAQILAITGSNGKTTTTALAAALSTAAGRVTVAAGNISPSALDALMAALDAGALPELWVLELSSFQLETTATLGPVAAAVLNLSEDHLDRYVDMAAYAAAKARILDGAATAVLNREDPRVLAMRRDGQKTVTFGLDVPPTPEDFGLVDGWIVRGGTRLVAQNLLRLHGSHNAANAMAALALCEAAGIELSTVLPALCAFAGLPHRVEWIARIDGVDYYDDSKGTNVGATLAALQGMGRPVAIILGGDGKGQDFSPLVEAIATHARHVALIGRDAARLEAVLAGCGVPMTRCVDMPSAVAACASAAQAGDAVLLSPACASLDMYRSYAHRAEVFVAAVRSLPTYRAEAER